MLAASTLSLAAGQEVLDIADKPAGDDLVDLLGCFLVVGVRRQVSRVQIAEPGLEMAAARWMSVSGVASTFSRKAVAFLQALPDCS